MIDSDENIKNSGQVNVEDVELIDQQQNKSGGVGGQPISASHADPETNMSKQNNSRDMRFANNSQADNPENRQRLSGYKRGQSKGRQRFFNNQ